MTPTTESGASVPSVFDRPTTHLVVISVYAVVATVLLWGLPGLPAAIRLPLALPLLLFAPGYAIVSALVPVGASSRIDARPGDATGWGGRDVSTVERVLLGIVASLALVPMAAMVVNAAVGVQFGPILAAITVITIVGAAIGTVRARPGLPRARGADSGGAAASWRRSLGDPLTVVAIVLTIALLGSSAALVVSGGEAKALETEFYLADDGSGATSPTTEATYDLRIAQDEVATQRYTVVVLEEASGSASSPVELDRFSVDVEAGDVVDRTVRVDDLPSGTTVRFLLYTGDAPDSPPSSIVHRSLRRTVNSTG